MNFLKKIITITGVCSILVYFLYQNKSDISSLDEKTPPFTQNILPNKQIEQINKIQITETQNEIKKDPIQNRKWKGKIKKDLLAFMPKKTKVDIEVLEVSPDIKNTGRDIAKITYTKEDGATSTFKALIESKTGKIERTWDQVIFEPNHKRNPSIAISGAL